MKTINLNDHSPKDFDMGALQHTCIASPCNIFTVSQAAHAYFSGFTDCESLYMLNSAWGTAWFVTHWATIHPNCEFKIEHSKIGKRNHTDYAINLTDRCIDILHVITANRTTLFIEQQLISLIVSEMSNRNNQKQ